MKKFLYLLLASIILVTGCDANKSGQSLSEEEIRATAQSMASTMISLTQDANIPPPTNTLEPTVAPTEPPPATDTLAPTEPALPTDTQFVPSPTINWPTETPTLFVAPNEVTLLKIINNTGKPILFIFTQPEYKEYRFTKELKTNIKFGTHYFLVWIGSEGPISGSITITMADKYEIVIDTDNIKVRIP